MKKKVILFTLLSIVITAISWFTNLGVIRLLYAVIPPVSLMHAIVVLTIGIAVTPFAEQKRIRLYNYLFCCTYVISNVLFPDANEELIEYMFFGLIENYTLCMVGRIVSVIALVVHVILLVLQVIELIRITNKSDF